ncbi:hypothetical protein L195_g040144, partial [Trifolium pratense]
MGDLTSQTWGRLLVLSRCSKEKHMKYEIFYKVSNASSASCQTNSLNPDTNEDDDTDEHEQE